MKTNYLTLSVMALAAAFTACSQDNEIPETNVSDNAQALTIQATESGFEAADAESRATDNGKTTVFEDGDQMGLFVVRDNGSVVKSNELITYNSTTKTWSTAAPVYYYTDADYIAYFPYDADLSVSETTTTDITDGIISAFDTYFEAHKADQSDLATYRNADLMLATITAEDLAKQTTENKTLNFALKHNYSMIELNVPSYKYSYTYGEGTKEFSVPMSNFNVTLGNTDVKPCHIGDGIYRMLVEPGDINLEGSFEDPKDQRPVDFSNSNATTKSLAKGNYVKYNISYKEAPSGDAEERDIIGDYYCQDGSIYPSDLQAVPTNAIGIVFSTVGDTDFAEGNYQYYVVSIKERKTLGFLVPNSEEQIEASNVNIAGIPSFDSTSEENFKQCLTDMAGWASTNVIKAITTPKTYNITDDLVDNWTGAFAAPESGTTGWFIPSIGQWMKLQDLLEEETVPSYTYTSTNNGHKLTSTTGGQTNTTLVGLLSKLNVESMSKTFNGCYWSLTQEAADEDGNSRLFCLDIAGNKFEIVLQEKTSKRILRPILAF